MLSDRVYLALTVIGLTLVITALYRWTRFGLDTRATAENEAGAYVSGISPDRIALLNWMLAGAVVGAAGILIAPLSPVVPSTYTLFVVPALAAAVVGKFQHLVPTAIAGIGIGMIQAWLIYLSGEHSWMPQSGVGEMVPLVVMLIALLVTSRGVPERGALLRSHLGRAPRPRSYLVPIVVGFAAGAIALLVTSGSTRAAVINTIIFAILALSLVVVTGYAGQVSLAQLALAGAGGVHAELPLGRLGCAVPDRAPPRRHRRGGRRRPRGPPRPAAARPDARGRHVRAGLRHRSDLVPQRRPRPVRRQHRRETGGVRDQPRRRCREGLPPPVLRLHVPDRLRRGGRRVSPCCAGARWDRRCSRSGPTSARPRASASTSSSSRCSASRSRRSSPGSPAVCSRYRQGIITWDSFAAFLGLTLVSTAYLAGVTSVFGGVQAGIIATGGIVFYLSAEWIDLSGDIFVVISGVLVIVTLIRNPEGLAAGGHELADKFAAWRQRRAAVATADASPTATDSVGDGDTVAAPLVATVRTAPGPDAPTVLEVEHVTVQYGGVVAVDDLSLRVPAGGIVGLIGPNGAGKTSAVDAITGFTKAKGAVLLDGERIDGLRSHQRVRRGLARTFQALELYDDLSVEENVSAAAYSVKGAAKHGAVQRSLDLVGIADLRARNAGDLSQGQRQLVSIARACAADPKVLLLDEPAAGLDTTESRWLGDRIRNISVTGTGILLIDHDVALVLDVCDYIYVLDFGRVIAEGEPAAIRTNRDVADAYLGHVHDATTTRAHDRPGSSAQDSPADTAPPPRSATSTSPSKAAPSRRSSAPTAPARPRCSSPLAGFLPPHAGTVAIDGTPLKPGRPARANKAGIVLVPDNRNLFTTLTVEENLRTGVSPWWPVTARHARACSLPWKRAGSCGPARSPAASNRCSPWPGRSCRNHGCSSSTR